MNSDSNDEVSVASSVSVGPESVSTEVPMIDYLNSSSSEQSFRIAANVPLHNLEQAGDYMNDGDGDGDEHATNDDTNAMETHDDANESTNSFQHEHNIDNGIHSYLPGVQRAIYPAELLRCGRTNTVMQRRDCTSGILCNDDGSSDSNIPGISSRGSSCPTRGIIHNLPILQLDAVVPFPGTTLPLRISNPILVEYLRKEIEDARAMMPAVLQTVTGMHTGPQSLDGRNGDGTVKIGVVTRMEERRRNQVMEWQLVQRRVGSRRNRGNSGDDDAEGDDNNENNRNEVAARGGRMGRWNIHLIRLNRVPTRYDDGSNGHDDDEEGGTGGDSSSRSSSADHRRRQLRRRHREESSINYGRNAPRDKLVGRIGTIATIISVHEDEDGQWDRGEDGVNDQQRSSIIVTALMTDRFRIIAPVSENSNHGGQMYNVREFNDEGVDMQSNVFKKPHSWPDENKDGDNDDISSKVRMHVCRNQSYITRVSARTYMPTIAFEHMFPAKVVQDILQEINSRAIFEGMKTNLPSIPDTFDGDAFSFWLSSNLPLSMSEKLDVLETYSTVERLHLLLKFMRKRVVFIRCRRCRNNIARVNDIFVVGNAEGTSGAYVNEHGVVHQTTTLTDVLDDSIVCHGGAETRDSWFPGYAWTIAYCSLCYSHLGWKFERVQSGRDSAENVVHTRNQPEQFWGLSGSQII